MGIIFVIVFGTLLTTVVLFIHGRKIYTKPLSLFLRNICTNHLVWTIILKPPTSLIDLWTEYGVVSETRVDSDQLHPMILEKLTNRVFNFLFIKKVYFNLVF